jgi:hypothetical protein
VRAVRPKVLPPASIHCTVPAADHALPAALVRGLVFVWVRGWDALMGGPCPGSRPVPCVHMRVVAP